MFRCPAGWDHFVQVEFARELDEFRRELSSHIPNCYLSKLYRGTLASMRQVVVSRGQIGHAGKPSGCSAGKVRQGKGGCARVGLFNDDKGQSVCDARKRLGAFAGRIAIIVVEGRRSQELRGVSGDMRGQGIAIETPEGFWAILPLARIPAGRPRHANAGAKSRRNECWRPEGLIQILCEFLLRRQWLAGCS